MNHQAAIITGAAQGIGRSITMQLADRYSHFALFDIQTDKLEELKQELESTGHTVIIVQQDVRDVDGLQENIRSAIVQLGRVDVLVNCAGIWQTKEFMEITSNDWDHIMSINLKSVFFAMQAVAPYMMEQRSGNIINIASVAGRGGRLMAPHYAVTKAAVINLTQSAAKSLAPYKVRVNSVCPGIIGTEMWSHIDQTVNERRGNSPGHYLKERLSEVPLGRTGSADEIAKTIDFLVSDDASYITGQAINICGGMEMN